MSRWFRMYDEILDDPKVQKLPADLFRFWVNALALCSRSGGQLPPIPDIAFALRVTEESVSSAFHALTKAGLTVTNGETFQPKNWKKRQYKSDSSTDRVREYRKRSRNGGETSPDTETDTETERKKEDGAEAPNNSFAFFGRTLRLKPNDFDRWKRTYHTISDLEAELTTIDAWWEEQPVEERKKWFHRTAGMLNRKHQANLGNEDQSSGWNGFA